MGVIKSQNAPPSLAPFSMRDIESHARAILLRARQEAEQELAKAHTDAAIIRQNAYDQGFAAGTEDGLKKGTEDGRTAGKQAALAEHKTKLEQLTKTLTACVTQIETSRTKFDAAAAAEVIKLAVAIARRVTKLHGKFDPNVLTENVVAAMKLVVHAADVRIAVHTSQKQSFEQLLPDLRMRWPTVKHVEIVPDDTLAPGSCKLFTAGGEIDAELDRQIDRVAADLLPGEGLST